MPAILKGEEVGKEHFGDICFIVLDSAAEWISTKRGRIANVTASNYIRAMEWDGANNVFIFCSGEQPGFFYRQRRLFDFVPFQPAIGQARRWVVADIREPALGNIRNHTQTHRAKPWKGAKLFVSSTQPINNSQMKLYPISWGQKPTTGNALG